MGLLVNGRWTDRWYDTSASEGRFLLHESAFRNWITPDGRPGPTGDGGFKAEPGRYQLDAASVESGSAPVRAFAQARQRWCADSQIPVAPFPLGQHIVSIFGVWEAKGIIGEGHDNR